MAELLNLIAELLNLIAELLNGSIAQ